MRKNHILLLIHLCLCLLFLLPACQKEIPITEKSAVYCGYNVFHSTVQMKLAESDKIIELEPSILFDETGKALYYRNVPANITGTIYYENATPVKVVFDMETWAAMNPTKSHQ